MHLMQAPWDPCREKKKRRSRSLLDLFQLRYLPKFKLLSKIQGVNILGFQLKQACICVCVLCVCERESERERKGGGGGGSLKAY